MEDIYAALMGEPVSEEEKMRALAKKLAVQRSMGQTGQILGGRLLEAPSSQMIGSADKSAQELADFAGAKRGMQHSQRMAEDARAAAAQQDAIQREFQAGENAKERALRLSLERMQQGNMNAREARAEAKLTAANQKELDRYVERYGKERDKADLPAMKSYIADADAILGKYEGKPIPGIGFMDMKSRFTQEGSETKQAVQAVQNALLKALSGAAVTQSEADRLEKQMFGPLATEASFRAGWQSLKNAIAAKEENIDQSYDPLVVETYQSRKKPATAAAGATGSWDEAGIPSFEEWKAGRNK